MRRLTPLALIVCACAVACGGASSTTVVLRPVNPLLANVYIAIRGPNAAANEMARLIRQGPRRSFIVAPATHGQEDCSFTREITPGDGPSLEKYVGKKLDFVVYGESRFAPAVCHSLRKGFARSGLIYRIPSSSMEPTIHCAKPATGCRGVVADRVRIRRTGAAGLQRDDIVVFNTPKTAVNACGEGGLFVKRIIGLPGETVREDDKGFIWIRSPNSTAWAKLNEPYVSAHSRALDTGQGNQTWTVPAGEYFMMGDNRGESCDSRQWGSAPGRNILGPVTEVIRGGTTLKPLGVP